MLLCEATDIAGVVRLQVEAVQNMTAGRQQSLRRVIKDAVTLLENKPFAARYPDIEKQWLCVNAFNEGLSMHMGGKVEASQEWFGFAESLSFRTVARTGVSHVVNT